MGEQGRQQGSPTDLPGSAMHGPHETLPHVGNALDGSQFCNVIEEQRYAEQRPSAAEQQPWRIRHLHDKPDGGHPDPAGRVSLGG